VTSRSISLAKIPGVEKQRAADFPTPLLGANQGGAAVSDKSV